MNNFNEYTKIDNNIYIIDLLAFDSSESFSLSLLEFIGKFSMLNRNIRKDCTVYILEFTDGSLVTKQPFLFPFVDKNMSFNDIYDTYVLNLDSEYLELVITINS